MPVVISDLTKSFMESEFSWYCEEEIRRVFLECDTDGNKVLTKDEIERAFAQLGALFPSYRAWRALRHADANKDGCISMEELDNIVRYADSIGYKRK